MLRVHFAIAVVLLGLTAPALAGASLNDARLRPQSSRVRGWLARGLDRSATTRDLVARIEQGDVVVYLDLERQLGPGVAACVTWMAATPARRYVRITLRADLGPNEALAMLAHELQHVVEVIEHPDVRSSADLAALYERIGHRTGWTGRTWDTLAALRAGRLTRTELASGA